jgi:hypothetical protein
MIVDKLPDTIKTLRVCYSDEPMEQIDSKWEPITPLDISEYYKGQWLEYRKENELRLSALESSQILTFPSYRECILNSVEVYEIPIETVLNNEQAWLYTDDYQTEHRRGSCVGDTIGCLSVRIARCSNLIAARTRRGAGRNISLSPNSIIHLSLPHYIIDQTDSLEPDEILIRYIGNEKILRAGYYDTGFLAEILPDGSVNAAILQTYPKCLSKASDYSILLRLV